ncbi:MAG: DUF255 domain-containing protein, partial [Flavobacterium sp.]|uniref:thioredoxin domain-containing protein n=1 Tax=Flavobacterium sp. TaxID=239 RepID=UPI002FC8AA97
VMNAYFSSFKIDREELPAVDAYYMQALQIMTKQGGWPLNIVALPNGLPVWGATYVPKNQWIDILQQLNILFEEDPEKMYDYADKLQKGIALANDTLQIYPKETTDFNLEPLLDNWKKSFDLELGGYQRAPKFMMPTNLNFLYQYGLFNKDTFLTNYVELTLTKMAYGGLFDVVEGGFSRYSVDHKWHIPHFEKMLYDNAQLLVTYTNAYINIKNELFKEVVQKTVNFILNNWQDSSGGFYTAYDADSLNSNNKLEEGAYYFWMKAELEQLISKDEWHLFADIFSINSDGFWEEANAYVLFQKDDLKSIAKKHNLDVDQLQIQKTKWENILLKNRHQRIKPLLDDKIIISWNAQLLSGFLSARKIITSLELDAAIENLTTFLQFKAYKNDNLGRVYKNDQNYISGNLEDYAFTIKSFLELFNETQDIQHLKFAQNLTFQALDLFFDAEQGFFKSSENETIGTVFEIEDNVIPSANAIMARNLFYLGFLYKNNYFMQLSQEMTNRILGQVNYASAYSEWLINNLIFKEDFEYIVLKDVSKEELSIINQKSTFKIILDNSLNVPILSDYKDQNKRFQVCNMNSCRLITNNINKLNN